MGEAWCSANWPERVQWYDRASTGVGVWYSRSGRSKYEGLVCRRLVAWVKVLE